MATTPVGLMERDVPALATAVAGTTIIGRVPRAGTVTAVTYTPVADVTGVATNNRAIAVVNKGQDGNGTTVIASLTFGNGTNASDFDERAMTLSGTPANLNVAEGDILAFASTVNGTGLADPGGYVAVTIGTGGSGHNSAGYIRGFP